MVLGKKRKASFDSSSAKHAGNIKQMKLDIDKALSGELGSSPGRWKSAHYGKRDRDSGEGKKGFTVRVQSRKELRKETRKLKKMRMLAFAQHKKLPTLESQAAEKREKEEAEKKKEREAKNKQRKKAEKKRKNERQKERAGEDRQKMLDANKDDIKALRLLEKKLKIKSNKSLPAAFEKDGLAFLLEPLSEAEKNGEYDETSVWEQELLGIESDSKKKKLKESQHTLEDSLDENSDNGDSENEMDFDDGEEQEEDLENDNDNESDDSEANDIDKSSDNSDINSSDEEEEQEEDINTDEEKIDLSDDSGEWTEVKRKKPPSRSTIALSDSVVNSPTVSTTPLQSILKNKQISSEKHNKSVTFSLDGKKNNKNKKATELVTGGKEMEKVKKGDWLEKKEDGLGKKVAESAKKKLNLDKNESINKKKGLEKKGMESDEKGEVLNKGAVLGKCSDLREDIYGRLVDAEGRLKGAGGAYVPPGKRLAALGVGDERRRAEREKLKRQIKGLINRLSDSNLQSIGQQLCSLYNKEIRGEVVDSLAQVLLDFLLNTGLIPDRLLQEQAALVTFLHSALGEELSAATLQALISQLAESFLLLSQPSCDWLDGKQADNILSTVAHLYNFKVLECGLIYDLLDRLNERFLEKDIELLLIIFGICGFNLRKDDPVRLKDFMTSAQQKAAALQETKLGDQSRIRFMLDVLLAVKNNNKSKLVSAVRYDEDHFDHLKKVLRGSAKSDDKIGSAVRVSLTDMLTNDKWWLTCSATQANLDRRKELADNKLEAGSEGVESGLIELARCQRMNTDIRRRIFYVIMQSEDYIDAFTRLQKLSLKKSQERELIHVLLDLCEQEKDYNPFYAHLAQKYCKYDRRYMMALQFSVWDRLKILNEFSRRKIRHLAAILYHLISTHTISLSVLKVIEFAELDKTMVALLRDLLTSLLTRLEVNDLVTVFKRVGGVAKLKPLRSGLKLFMHHFLLRRGQGQGQDQSGESGKGQEDGSTLELLKNRVEIVERALDAKH